MLLRTGQLLFKSLGMQTSFKNHSFTNKFFITEEKKPELNKKPAELTLEERQLMAELALDIYELIREKPANLDLKVKSLHESIMQTIHQEKEDQPEKTSKSITGKVPPEGKKYPEEVRKPFIEMFDEGFKIDAEIFSQERIVAAEVLIDQKKKIVFHPTYLITSQVFNELHLMFREKKILTGHRGISKTFSVCLFWHLVKFIDEYRFLKGVEVSKKMMRVPKIVYWSIGFRAEDSKQLILDQCPEIKAKYGDSYKWQVSIKKFYKKEFPEFEDFYLILVIDQINQVASIGRKIEQNEKIEDKKMKIKISRKHLALFFRSEEEIPFFIEQFDGFLGLSSMNIEQSFFKQIQMTEASNATILPIITVKFSEKIYEEESLRELVDYFMFEMDQRIFKNLSTKTISESDKKEMKNKCFDYLWNELIKEKKEYFFFTPCNIRELIVKLKEKISEFENVEIALIDKVIDEFKTMVYLSEKSYQNELLNYFVKKDDLDEDRIRFMFSVYNCLVENEKKQEITPILVQGLDLKFSNPEQIDSFLDKRLFNYNPGKKSLTLMLPPSFMKRVISSSVEKELELYTKFTLDSYKESKDKTELGKVVEKLLILALKKGNIEFSFTLKNEKADNKSTRFEFDLKKGIYKFLHLEKTFKKSSQETKKSENSNNEPSKVNEIQDKNSVEDKNSIELLTRFHPQINRMIEKNIKCAVLFPVTEIEKEIVEQSNIALYDITPTSKLIDLIFIKYDQEREEIKIWLIDVTVSKTEIRKKIYKFITQFLKFADKNITKLHGVENTPSVEINYVVFGPENNVKHDDLADVLKTKYGNEITFKTFKKSNVFTVEKLKNSENFNLKRVCYIDFGSDFEFIKNESSKKYIDTLTELLQEVSKEAKKAKEPSNN